MGAEGGAVVARAERLTRVLDDDQVEAAREGEERRQLGGRPLTCTGTMARVRGVMAASAARGHMPRLRSSTIDQDRRGAGELHRAGGGDEGEIGDQHLVARTDPRAASARKRARRAAGGGDRVRQPDEAGDATLEFGGELAVVE
jgi:hypothetical protein